MNKIFATLLLLALTITAVAQNITCPVVTVNGQPAAKRRVTLTYLDPGIFTSGNNLVAGDFVTQTTDTNGLTTFTNVLPGVYSLDVAGAPPRHFEPLNITNFVGTLPAVAFLVLPTNAPTTTGDNSTYSQNAANARFMLNPTNAAVNGYVPTATGAQSKWAAGGGGSQTNDTTKLRVVGGIGTNATFFDFSVSTTNEFFLRGTGTSYDGNPYYFARIAAPLRIFTNSNGSGYAMAYDAGGTFGFGTPAYILVSSTNGTPDTWDANIDYFANNVAGPWGDNLGGPNFDSVYPILLSGYGEFSPSIVANSFEGNLARGTNINGAFIRTGSIPGTALIHGTLTNLQGNIVTSGDVSTSNSLYGSIAGATAGTFHEGVIANRLPKLPFFVYFPDYPLGPNGYAESWFTNNVQQGINSGIIPALQAAGADITLLVTPPVTWANTNRDANGNIPWNTNAIPDGPVAFTAWMHARGVKVGLQNYFLDQVGDSAADVNGNIIALSGSGSNQVRVTTLNYVTNEINQWFNWSIDMPMINEAGGNQNSRTYEQQMVRVFNQAINQHTTTDNFAYDTNNMSLFAWLGHGGHLPDGGALAELNISFSGQGFGADTGQDQTPGYIKAARVTYTNVAYSAGQGSYHSLIQPGWIGSTSPWRDAGATNELGHCQAQLSAAAMFPAGLLMAGFTNVNITQSVWNTITNRTLLSIWLDPAYRPGCAIIDPGAGGKSIWVKPMSDGGYAVWFANETGTPTDMVFDWSTNVPSPINVFNSHGGYPFLVSSNSDFIAKAAFAETNVPVLANSIKVMVTNNATKLIRLYPRGYVKRSGDTMTGALTVSGASVTAQGVVMTGGTAGSVVFPVGGVIYEAVSGVTNLFFGYNANTASLGLDGTLTAVKFSGIGAGITGLTNGLLSAVGVGLQVAGSNYLSASSNLPAAQLTGSIADGRLSANVALLSGNQIQSNGFFSSSAAVPVGASNVFQINSTGNVAIAYANQTNATFYASTFTNTGNVGVGGTFKVTGASSIGAALTPLTDNSFALGAASTRFNGVFTTAMDSGANSLNIKAGTGSTAKVIILSAEDGVTEVSRVAQLGISIKTGASAIVPLDVLGTIRTTGSNFVSGIVYSTNGFASLASNLTAPVTIGTSITATNGGFDWTNNTGINITVYVDNAGVTASSLKVNGGQIFSSALGDWTVQLQQNQYIQFLYSVGTPTIKYMPH